MHIAHDAWTFISRVRVPMVLSIAVYGITTFYVGLWRDGTVSPPNQFFGYLMFLPLPFVLVISYIFPFAGSAVALVLGISSYVMFIVAFGWLLRRMCAGSMIEPLTFFVVGILHGGLSGAVMAGLGG